MKTNIALVAVFAVLAGCAEDAEPSSTEHADEVVRCACGPCAVMSACVSLCEGPPR